MFEMKLSDGKVCFDKDEFLIYQNNKLVSDGLSFDIYQDLIKIYRLSKFTCFKKQAEKKARKLLKFSC